MTSAKSATNELALIGDFNLCMEKWTDRRYQWNKLADFWKHVISDNGLMFDNLGITFESHYTLQSGDKVKSALDHAYFSNSHIFTNSRLVENSMSDHLPIMLDINTVPHKKGNKKANYTMKRSYKNFVNEEFLKDLALQPWESLAAPKLDVHAKAKFPSGGPHAGTCPVNNGSGLVTPGDVLECNYKHLGF